jgi:hypothetical protein
MATRPKKPRTSDSGLPPDDDDGVKPMSYETEVPGSPKSKVNKLTVTVLLSNRSDYDGIFDSFLKSVHFPNVTLSVCTIELFVDWSFAACKNYVLVK